jgi:putative membrane protein
MTPIDIAYCGRPPVPAELAAAWNLDAPLLLALAGLGWLIARYARRRAPGWLAFALLVLVFVSPLCALTAALFSARVLHHVVLVAMVAPLLVVAFGPRRALPLPSGTVFLAHWVLLWLWHAPGPYLWALDTVAGYWLMQTTLLASGWLLWRQALAPHASGRGLALLSGTVAQMGLLGALLVFAPEPLYPVHLATTAPWGLTPLEDQQLAGLLMWVPAMLPYLAAALSTAWRELAERHPAS